MYILYVLYIVLIYSIPYISPLRSHSHQGCPVLGSTVPGCLATPPAPPLRSAETPPAAAQAVPRPCVNENSSQRMHRQQLRRTNHKHQVDSWKVWAINLETIK